MNQPKAYGLIGKSLTHSFSKDYFTKKFQAFANGNTYSNFELDSIAELPSLLKLHPEISGLNVTIPYKESVIPFLDELTPDAAEIGAVNTIKTTPTGRLIGYNTDWFGFMKSIEPLLLPHHVKALVLGNGGASKAVQYALKYLHIEPTIVTRKPAADSILFNDLTAQQIATHQIIINCTPLGTSPHVEEYPPIPYEAITSKHLAFDLIYNPSESNFLKRAKLRDAVAENGYQMLVFQAEKAHEIWQS